MHNEQGPTTEEPIVDSGVQSTALNRRRHLSADQRKEAGLALDLWDLTKPEISFMVGLSAFGGFLLASPIGLDLMALVWTVLGVVLSSAGSGVMNHVMERRLDGLMKRTATRPLPSGRVSAPLAGAFGLGLIALGVGILFLLVNLLTAGLAVLTSLLYLFVYTPMKPRTEWNTLFGCLPGALPALGGWTGATGSIEAGGMALFLVLFFWQMPHFLAIAWMYRKDYARADHHMTSVHDTSGSRTALQMMVFSALTVAASFLPSYFGQTGVLYLVIAAIAGAMFLRYGWIFYKERSNSSARSMLLASVAYLPLMVAVIVVDRILL